MILIEVLRLEHIDGDGVGWPFMERVNNLSLHLTTMHKDMSSCSQPISDMTGM